MKKRFIILALAALSLATIQTLRAVPIAGALDFGGTARLDGTTVDTSTKVKSWGPSKVSNATGTFYGVNGLFVNLAPEWMFYSGSLNDFWDVGGFQFDLSLSSVFDDNGGVLTVVFAGSVGGNTYDPTAFTGSLKIQDPADSNGDFKYTGSLLYIPTPDGGTTALLLGLTLCGLVLIRRRQSAP